MPQSVSLIYYKSLTLQVLSYHTSAPSDEVSKIKVSVVSSVVCTKIPFCNVCRNEENRPKYFCELLCKNKHAYIEWFLLGCYTFVVLVVVVVVSCRNTQKQ